MCREPGGIDAGCVRGGGYGVAIPRGGKIELGSFKRLRCYNFKCDRVSIFTLEYQALRNVQSSVKKFSSFSNY